MRVVSLFLRQRILVALFGAIVIAGLVEAVPASARKLTILVRT